MIEPHKQVYKDVSARIVNNVLGKNLRILDKEDYMIKRKPYDFGEDDKDD